MIKLLLPRWVLVSVGVLATGLGIIGLAVPVLPTTPFLLLAAACFVRSSDRWYAWLINHRWFGSYIRYYREHKAVTLRTKVVALLVLWGAMNGTIWGIVTAWWLRILLAGIAMGVTIYILRLKTLTKEMLAETDY